MLKDRVIGPCKDQWANPIVGVPKTDGKLRFYVDYRRPNAVTQRDSYPIPRIERRIGSLGDRRIFITLDCNSAYWQVEIDKIDRHQTNFTSHF